MSVKKGYGRFQKLVILAAVVLLFGLRFLVHPHGLSATGLQIAGILAGGLLLWQFIGVGWTSMLVLLALMFVPALKPAQVVAGAMGNKTAIYLMLCFMMGASLQKTGLAASLAARFMTSRLARRDPWTAVGLVFLSIFAWGLVLSCTSTFMIFLPILTEIFRELGYRKGDGEKFPALMITSLLVVAQMAQFATPVSHAMTLMGLSCYTTYTGDEIEFNQYTAIGLPIAAAGVVLWYILCRFVFNVDVSRLNELDLQKIQSQIKPLTRREKAAGIVYGLVVVFWVIPGFASYMAEPFCSFFKEIDALYPPIVGVIALNLLHADGRPVMDYREALKSVPWHTVIFMGTILYLSSLLPDPSIGLAGWISERMTAAFRNVTPQVFIALLIVIQILATNFLANAVVITITFAVAMPLVSAVFAGQVSAALTGILITVASSCSFATPTATPPVAVALDTGWVSTGQIFRWGMSIALVCMFLVAAIGLPLGNLLVK